MRRSATPHASASRLTSRGDLPFATGTVDRQLNALLESGKYPELNRTAIGLLRALITLADWRTGAIPAGLDKIAALSRIDRCTVSRLRTQICAEGLLVERWRSGTQVEYGLGNVLRKENRNAVAD